MQKSTTLLLLLISISVLSQESISLAGILNDQTDFVKNAHIYNVNSEKGTISNDKGEFNIEVSLDDKIEITSIQHYKRVILITQEILNDKKIEIEVYLKSYMLNEVEIDNENLFDKFQKTVDPKMEDIALVKAKSALDFSNVKIEANENYEKTEKEQQHTKNVTDPTRSFDGVSLFKLFSAFSSITKSNKQKKEIAYKEKFPTLIKEDLGEDFFYKKLGIPKEKYYHFLSYCQPLGIEEIYKNSGKLEVMDIFIKEHKNYLKLIKEE